VRGGRFVGGPIGEQYALAEAVEGLRRIRREERAGETVRIAATDPLNLVGILSPGPRVPAHPGSWLEFIDGAHVPGEASTVLPRRHEVDATSSG
jgi:ATP-dependent Lhr-like helicase